MKLNKITPTKKGASGSSTSYGYKIEARRAGYIPGGKVHKFINEVLITDEWVELDFTIDCNPAGVPHTDGIGNDLSRFYLIPYESARALAYTVLAQNSNMYGLELRLVVYKVETSFQTYLLGTVEGEISHAGEEMLK